MHFGEMFWLFCLVVGVSAVVKMIQDKNAALAAGGKQKADVPPAKPKRAQLPEADPPNLRVLIRGGHEDCPVDTEPFKIGRRPDSNLVLDHEHVSRLHAELRREDGRWYIIDSGSANGLYVNGRKISGEALAHEDKIRIGPFQMLFVHPAPPPPQVFDVADLTLEKELGHGGMARVYLAKVNSDGSLVAVKMPSFSRCKDEHQRAELRKRFLREVEISEGLRHPNIVRVLGHGTTPEQVPYMVMEYLQGGTMRSTMQAGKPMEEQRVRSIGAELASGLTFAHSKVVVHRDIKPENVLFDENGRSKLSDFGIARARDLPSLTVPGMVLGTCHYMSPEQVSGDTITPASDIYSLGCMLYEMSVGRCPFEGDGLAIMRAHLREQPARARSLNPSLSPEIDQAIDRMLEKAPARRPPIDEVQRLLQPA